MTSYTKMEKRFMASRLALTVALVNFSYPILPQKHTNSLAFLFKIYKEKWLKICDL